MTNLFHTISLSLLLSSTSSHAIHQSLTHHQKIGFFVCIAAGCSVSLYIAHKYRNNFSNYCIALYKSFFSEKIDDSLSPKTEPDQTINTQIKIIAPTDIHSLSKAAQQHEQAAQAAQKKIIKGTTVLHQACEDNDTNEVIALLNNPNTQVNAQRHSRTVRHWNDSKEIQGETALHLACKNGNSTIVQALLEKGADVNIQTKHDETAIYFAYINNHKEIFLRLLEIKNINLQAPSYSYKKDLLYNACEKNDTEAVVKLLELSSEKKIFYTNNNALYIACDKGYADLVTLLLAYNAKHNDCMKINNRHNNYNPLHIACINRNIPIIKQLLDHSFIDIEREADYKKNVLHLAASHLEILKLLVTKNTKNIINKRSELHRNTPLHGAMIKDNLPCILLLLEHGANISVKNDLDETPLSLACYKGLIDIVHTLLMTKYVTPEIINSSDCLYESMHIKDCGIPELLLSYGANPNNNNTKKSPLFKAASEDIRLLNLFIDHYHGDIYQKNNERQSLLYAGFMSNNITDPHQLNFFTQFNAEEKNRFMIHELDIIAHFTPTQIGYISKYKDTYEKGETNKKLCKFDAFIAACIKHGKIDLNQKNNDNKTLLDQAYEELETRINNYNLKKCMRPGEGICCSSSRFDVFIPNQCNAYIRFNEVIIHSLLRHTPDNYMLDDKRAADKHIALTIAKEPAEYYTKNATEKERIKNYVLQSRKG